MIQHFIKIATRIVSRNKFYFVLNALGVTLGISCCITLGRFIYSELNFDTFFKDAHRLYRVTTYFKRGDQEIKWAITSGGLVPLLQNNMSNVEEATMCMTVQTSNTFIIDDKTFSIPERTGFYVDRNFLSVLNFPVMMGTDSTMFKEPHSIALTESFAHRLFGRSDVLGEGIILKNFSGNTMLTISGILKDPPQNSHMQFDYFFPGALSPQWHTLKDPKSGGFPVHVYFRVTPLASDSILTATLSKLTKPVFGNNLQFPIQKVKDIHFHADNLFEHTRKGNIKFIRILSAVTIFILVITIINCIILSSSFALRRMKEVGVRKAIGSSTMKIAAQFLTESVLLTSFAGILSLALCEFVFQFGFPTWLDLTFSLSDEPAIIPLIFALTTTVGLIAGIFPVIQASRRNAIGILRGQRRIMDNRRVSLNSILVTSQFVFTLAILAGTLVVTRQLAFLKTKDLGFNRDWIVNIPRPTEADISLWNSFIQSIKNESVVKSTSTTLYKFLSDYNATGIQVIDDTNDTTTLRVQWNAIDYDLINTMDMQISMGRNFSPDIAGDTVAMLINETAARLLRLSLQSEQTVLARILGNQPGKIIGVVRDFHFQSFDKEIIPIAFILTGRNFAGGMNLLVKLQPSSIPETINILRTHWNSSGIEAPFEYTFMEEWFNTLIKRERQISTMIVSFTILTIIISLLGLMGLVSSNIERMRKEMGIRKVYGASISQILIKVNTSFISMVAFALILAIPLSRFGINRWLDTFAYKVTLSIFDYVIATTIFVSAMVIIITAQSWSTARANPTLALKEE